MEDYHFIYDYQNDRLNIFRTFRGPDYVKFGDIDGDSYPDFLSSKFSGYVYNDTGQEVCFRPYRMTATGTFQPLKRDGKDCYMLGQFDGGRYAARNFVIKEKYWIE